MIELAQIRPDADQPRREFSPDELANLTASIRERGIKQPLRVWQREEDNVYQIISGERRYRAALAAGLPVVPCIIEDPPAGQAAPPRREILVDQIVENWQREDLNPYDLSDALKELRDAHGMTQEDIARLTGKPKSEISRYLAMQQVTAAVQQEIRQDTTGRFSRRHVVAVSQLAKPEQQQHLAAKIKTEKLTAAEAEREAARLKGGSSGHAVRGAPVTIRRYAVGPTKVQITFRKREVSPRDVLNVLDRVRAMVEPELDPTTGK